MKKKADAGQDPYYLIEPCASANGFEIKLREGRIDLKKAEAAISVIGQIGASMPVVLIARLDDLSLSIYASGRIMMKRPGARITNSEAESAARRLMDALRNGNALVAQ